MSFHFKTYSLVESVYLFIRCNKTRFFLQNTNNTDRNGVNKQNTHTPNTQRKITLKKGGPTMSLDAFEFLIFDSSREASNDANSFLNLRFIKKQKPAVFIRKYYMLTISKLMFHSTYLTFCRKQYLAELEKNFLRFRKFFVVPMTFSKIKKYLVSICIQISQELQ